tara:strand:+ start:8703 stop:10865 length:2163 start_codon:yes stop_codon:yes gene_type:complete
MGGFRPSPNFIPSNTQIGTLTSSNHQFTGSVEITGSLLINGVVISQNGGGAAGTVAGANTQIQYNNAGAFGASSAFTFDGTNLRTTGSVYISSSAVGSNVPLLRLDHAGAGVDNPVLFVTGSGFVGIGTDEPSHLVHIKSAGKASMLIEADTDNTPETDTAYIKLTQDNNATRMIVGLNGNSGADPDGVYLANAMSNAAIVGPRNAGSPLQLVTSNRAKVAITDDGQVGVGDGFAEGNSPTAILHISGGIAAQGTAKSSPLLKIKYDNVDNILFVTGSGRVGINTGTPVEALDVADDTDASARIGRAHIGWDGTNSDYATFAHRDQATSANYALQQRANGDTVVNGKSGGNLSLRLGGINALIVDGTKNNNVGINVSPEARLHVAASTPEKDVFRLDGDINNILYVSGSGRVGIGTGTPLAQLHISASAGADGNLLRIDHPGSRDDNPILFVTGSGFVGIGVPEPTYHLHVASSYGGEAGGTTRAFKVEDELGSEWFSINGGTISFNAGGGSTRAGGIDLGQRFNIAPINATLGALGIGKYPGSTTNIVQVNSANTNLSGNFFVIDGDGKVGIGIPTNPIPAAWAGPTQLLDVRGNAAISGAFGSTPFETRSTNFSILSPSGTSIVDTTGLANNVTYTYSIEDGSFVGQEKKIFTKITFVYGQTTNSNALQITGSNIEGSAFGPGGAIAVFSGSAAFGGMSVVWSGAKWLCVGVNNIILQ